MLSTNCVGMPVALESLGGNFFAIAECGIFNEAGNALSIHMCHVCYRKK